MRQPVSWRLPNYSTRVSQTTMLCLNQLWRSSDLHWQLLQCAHVTISCQTIYNQFSHHLVGLGFISYGSISSLSVKMSNQTLWDKEKKIIQRWYYMTLSSPLSTLFCPNNAKNICSECLSHISRKVKQWHCFEGCI